jgi:L-fuculose-phosphate aldolase
LKLEGVRRGVADALRRIEAGGLVLGTAGNVSARDRGSELVAVSPSSVPYAALGPEDVCLVDVEGAVVEGARRPSFELPMHLAILRARPEVGAVVHTHSPHATALGCVLDEIPVVAPEQAATAGGAVPVCPYAPTGDAAMGDAVLAAAAGRWAAIVRNHGPVCLGRDLEHALACAFAVEETARIFALARLHGEPALLDEAEVERFSRRRPASAT